MLEFVQDQKIKSDLNYAEALAAIKKGDFAVASEMAQHADCFVRCQRYAAFLSLKLKVEMFVPISEIRPLPIGKDLPPQDPNPLFPELEDKVLFKDLVITYTGMDKNYHINKTNKFFVISGPKGMFNNNLTIDHLVHRDLELTDLAVKLIFKS